MNETPEVLRASLGEITWYHNIALLDKVSGQKKRLWYAQKTIKNGWSRNVLVVQIARDLYSRQGGAVTNFKETLPSPQSDLAQALMKSSYNSEFLSIDDKVTEKKLEKVLINHIRDFMLELGQGFAFVGSQYPLKLQNETYFLDLLFYNIQLKTYTIIEFKMGPFKPEYAGKMNFYLNVMDKNVKGKDDNQTIGIILCREHDHITVRYALDGINRPLGISEYKLSRILEKRLKESLRYPFQ